MAIKKIIRLVKNQSFLLIFLTIVSIHFWTFTSYHPISFYSDSYIYLELSEHLSQGKGYQIAHSSDKVYSFYPPLYSMSIAVVHQLTGLDFRASIRLIAYLSILFFFYFFDKILKFYQLNKAWRLSILFLLWFSLAYSFYYVALSEHIFYPLFLAQTYYLLKWQRYRNDKYLWISGFLMGLMLLSRYAALGVFAAEILWLLWTLYQDRQKILKVLFFMITPMIIFGTWHLILFFHNTASMGRQFVFHPPNKIHFKDLIISFVNWFSPGMTPYFFGPIALLLLWILFKEQKSFLTLLQQKNIQLWLFILVGFLLFVTATISFFDFTTSYDTRIIIPVYFSFILIFILFFAGYVKRISGKILAFLFLLIIISHMIFFLQVTFLSKPKMHYETVNRILKNNRKFIYSNVPDLFPDALQRDTLLLQTPYKYDPKSTLPNDKYDEEINQMKQHLKQDKALIIYFKGFEDRDFNPSETELKTWFVDQPVKTFKAGFVIGRVNTNAAEKSD